jgi:lysozyme
MSILETMLKVDEGLKLSAYTDTMGNKTIGYGHKITPDDNLPMFISQEQADNLLGQDIDNAIHGVLNALPWVSDLDEVRQAVLYNMAFNLGIHGLLAFRHTLKSVQAGDYQEAATNMMQSRWYNQVGIRAKKLSAIMNSGIMPEDYANFNPQ